MEKPRVRFAPSPTGNLHVGGARTALFNWLFAKRYDGKFVLRVEDTDRERSSEEFTRAILDGLRWLGIDWDEGPEIGGKYGPYFQSKRFELYSSAIETLVATGRAYHCFCTPKDLENMREKQAAEKQQIKYEGRCRNISQSDVEMRVGAGEKWVVRLKVPDCESIGWEDLVKGPMNFSANILDDLIIARSDGQPTYNLAVVVDDSAMEISHVIRGEDHISNTPKQIILYRALGKPVPEFAHIPLMLGPDRSRLSKRHGATSLNEFQNQGLDAPAFRNYLALQGWSPGPGREILSLEEMKSEFSLEKVSTHGAIFNPEKLLWMNAEYLKRYDRKEFFSKATPFLLDIEGYPGDFSDSTLEKMVSLFPERIKTFKEITSHLDWFFSIPETYDAKGMEKIKRIPQLPELIEMITSWLEKAEDFTRAELEQNLRAFAEENRRKFGDIVQVLRLSSSGRTATPGMFEVLEILGKEKCLLRFRIFAKAISG